MGLGGGSLGFLASGNVGTAAAGAVAGAAVGGARTGLNKMSASLMMNRDVTQWIKTAPRSVSPAAIDAHFQRLTQIATRNPAIAEGVKELQSFLMQAANSIPGKLAARENEKNSGPTPPKK